MHKDISQLCMERKSKDIFAIDCHPPHGHFRIGKLCRISFLIFLSSFTISTKCVSAGAVITSDAKEDSSRDKFYYDSFPDGFRWGVSSSAYQTEGAWNLDGKEDSIWDTFSHAQPSKVIDNSSGDVACDSYHNYKQDVQFLQDIEARVYRFSISWSRILPKGTTEKINEKGIDYYNNLINELISKKIEPMITLFHNDLPQDLQDDLGWLNEETIQLFVDYARIVFDKFGDRVKLWVTFNGPNTFCINGYTDGNFAPGEVDPATGPYQCVHSIIKAHALAYSIYREEFKEKQKGKVGIAVDFRWQEPEHKDSEVDKQAAEQANAFSFKWIVDPIFKGDYPAIMRDIIDKKSSKEKRNSSRLPSFDKDWKQRINGSTDFLGVNHYTTELVRFTNTTGKTPSWDSDSGTERFFDPTWPSTGSSRMKVVPWGIRRALNYIKSNYGNPQVIITENGVSDGNGELKDTQRVTFFRQYINEALKAVKLDGCNLTHYLAWSLLDSFQWERGYTEKFGLYNVDFTSPNRTRTPKRSAKSIAKIFIDNGFLIAKFHTLDLPANTNSTSLFSSTKFMIVIAVSPFILAYSVYS